MKLVVLLLMFLFAFSASSEEVPAGYVVKWDVVPLSKKDYEFIKEKECQTFSSVLKEAKSEWPHTNPFKIVNDSLTHFIEGYNIQENLLADVVVIWPNYSSSEWYVLMGNENCFVRWIEIQPDNIQSIMNEGRKKLSNKT